MSDESTAAPVPPMEAEAAFQEVVSEIDQMPADLVQPINADVAKTAGRVLGYEPGIVGLIPQIREHCPTVSLVPITRLRTYARAAFHAHAVAAPVGSSSSPMGPIISEAEEAREKLLVWATPLAHSGVLDANAIARIREGQGHYDLAVDLESLANLFGEHWNDVRNKTALKRADLVHARVLGSAILDELAKREKPTTGVRSQAAERRARAYTLMLNAYDVCRRVVTFLRWDEGDADDIAPSLFKGRGGGRRPATPPEPEETVLPPPAGANAAPQSGGG